MNEKLIYENYKTLRGFTKALARHSHNIDPDDLLQDSIIKMLTSTYNPQSQFTTWACTIIRNSYIDQLRKSNVRPKITHQLTEITPPAKYDPTDSNLLTQDIITQVNLLSPKLKATMMLRIHGYDYQSISEITHEPLGTIKARIHRARNLLNNMICQQ